MLRKGDRIRVDVRGLYFDHDGARWVRTKGGVVGTVESVAGPILHVRTDPTPEEPFGTLLKTTAIADGIRDA